MSATTNISGSIMTFHTFQSLVASEDMKKFPADFFSSDEPPPPFMINKVLYVPLHLAGSSKISAGVIAFLFSKVACSTSYATGVKILDTPAKIKESGLRISSQGESLLKKADAGDKLYSKTRSSRFGFRCRADEVVRQLALGLTALNTDDLTEALVGSDYNFNNALQGVKGDPLTATLLNMYRDGKVPTVFMAGTYSSWHIPRFLRKTSSGQSSTGLVVEHAALATSLAAPVYERIVRTAAPVVPEQVQKWRKPPRSSVWPWTLDNHWFLCEGNSISSAHHSMMALVENDNSGSDRKDQIARQLPVVGEQLILDKLRKILEAYFSDLNVIMSGAGPKYGDYVRENNNVRWLGTGARWSTSTTDPHHSPVIMCLALGVRPKIEGGKLVKFIPAEDNLIRNTRKFHCKLTPKELNSASPKVTMIALYTCGLISESVFMEMMGGCLQDEDVANLAGNVSMPVSSLVTVLIPKESWYIGACAEMKTLLDRRQLLAPLSQANLPDQELVAQIDDID